MTKLQIKKGDNVLVIAGKDRGKIGIIQNVLPGKNKVIITGINIAKHHLKPSRKNPHGGIIDMNAPIDVSNVLMVCPHCGKAIRIAHRQSGNVKERICRKCQGNLDTTPVKEKNVKA